MLLGAHQDQHDIEYTRRQYGTRWLDSSLHLLRSGRRSSNSTKLCVAGAGRVRATSAAITLWDWILPQRSRWPRPQGWRK